jgi:sensor histidine kinase YesM
MIKLENSYHGTLKMANGVYVSSKSDSKLHGYGLKNVKRIAQKYHGSLELSHDENRFYVTVILYI